MSAKPLEPDQILKTLTEEEVYEFGEAFELFDKDKGGSISAEELGDAMHSLGLFSSPEEMEEMVKEVDLDGNGTIDFPEFCVMMKRMIEDTDPEIRELSQVVTSLTQDESDEFWEAFKIFDRNHDGCITADEVFTVMNSLGYSPKAKDVEDMIAAVDIDGNGVIEFVEFCVMMKRMMKQADQETIREAFAVFDKDGSGKISVPEFKVFIKKANVRLSTQDIETMIAEIDSDGDGEINFEEFVAMMSSHYEDTESTNGSDHG